MLYEAVGVPDGELKEFCPYWGLARTVVRSFNKVPICSMRPFIMVPDCHCFVECCSGGRSVGDGLLQDWSPV
jgi:hypothetical protein